MSPTIRKINNELDRANQKRNDYLDKRAELHGTSFVPNATRYDVAKRIKGDKLLLKNSSEEKWPGGRTHFEIDRDQILFNPNFVRLAQKSQVFIGQKNIQFKNRLMHTLEVVQLSRSIAQTWSLNIDLIESIAYGHDIGHTPFGHAGEEALNMCLYEFFIRQYGLELSDDEKPILSFEHSDSRKSYRDSSIWLLISSIVNKRSTDQLPLEADIKKQLGEDLYNVLKNNKRILNVDNSNSSCNFNPPMQWDILDSNKELIKGEFWLRYDDKQLFSHNTNALHVLLNDKKRDASDISYHTAFGILSHSWQGAYETFKFKLLDGEYINFSKSNHETPEAFVVRFADDICFTNSDLNDIKNSQLLKWNEFGNPDKTEIWKLKGDPTHRSDYPPSSAILSNLETLFDFSSAFDKNNISNSYNVDLWQIVKNVRNIISKEAYPKLIDRQATARKIIRDLFWFYSCFDSSNKRKIEEMAYKKYEKYIKDTHGALDNYSRPKQAVDYISHLTDEEAISIHTALYSPEQAQWARYFLDLRQD